MVMAFLLRNSSFPLLVFHGFFRGDRHKTRLEGKERRKGTFKREKGAPRLISLLLFRAVTGGREEGEGLLRVRCDLRLDGRVTLFVARP